MLVLIVIVGGDEELVPVDDKLELLVVSDGLDRPGGYPSHVRPVLEHFLHVGLALSHLIRRILRLCQLASRSAREFVVNLACKSCIHQQS